MSETYQTRLERIKKVVKKKELPDKVPCVFMLNGWIIEYYGETLRNYYQDKPDITPAIYKKGIEEFQFDGSFNLNNVSSYTATAAMGGGMYAVSDNGIQVSNIATAMIMQEDEYPLLIKDFPGFLRDYIMPRRYSVLSKGNTDEALDALKTALNEKNKFFATVATGWKQIEADGCPIMWNSGALGHPIDFLFDYLRDFKGITLDIRRRPGAVMDAMKVIQDYLMKNVFAGFKSDPDYKGPFWPTHLACFLRPKDYATFYHPYFKETLEYCIDNEIYSGIVFEGDWTAYFDLMQDIPDNDILIGSMEFGDYKNFKEKLGSKFAICGGMPLSVLGLESREKTIDFTKQLLDDCAPGGGFMVTTDKAMLRLRDANPENFKAMIETLDTYGRY